MERNLKRKFIIAAVVSIFAGTQALAQQSEPVAGNIRAVKVEGSVWQVTAPASQRFRLSAGDLVMQGVVIETGMDGSAILLFDNGSTMSLRSGTTFSISEFLRDPFDAGAINYRELEAEPSDSVTKVSVQKGTVYFDIPKLRKDSICDIANPLGTAGIRGTAGFVAEDSMGVTEGLVQVRTVTGQTQNLRAGQTTGFTPQGNFAPPPSNAPGNMQGATENSQDVQQIVEPDAFSGANQAPTTEQGALTAEQQQQIEEGAQQGEDALVEAVQQIASESPEAAAAAAAAAATLMPSAAPTIASAAASAIPAAAAESVAPQIAAAVAAVAPSAASQVAAAVAVIVPNSAPQVAAAVAVVVPNSAPEVAAAVATAVPSQAASVQAAVVQAVPAQAQAVANAVAPGSGASTSTTSIPGNTQSTTQNPANFAGNPTPSPTPAPTPTPTPPPVSPSF